MEADWEVEVGGGAPAIEAHWPGFVDLRLHPDHAWQLPEAAQLPGLAEVLAKLNALVSPVWTSKCDFWPVVERDEFDADELDAPPGCSANAMGCYIDLLPRGDRQWEMPAAAAAACKRLCGLLRAVPLRCCRVDFVIRSAFIAPDLTGPTPLDLGITAYLTACGPSAAEAAQTLAAALEVFAGVLHGQSTLE
jgi:hypothetical protein